VDGRSYTITLRPGVRWDARPPLHGRELVAADVKRSLQRAVKRPPGASLLGPVEGIEVPARHTLRVHLAEAFAPFLHRLAEPWTAIVPPEVEERPGDAKAPEALLGCGPFLLERYEPGIKAVFVRNPHYYRQGLPLLDRIEWLFIRDRATALSLFRAGQVDLPSHDGRLPHAEAASFRKTNPGYPIASWDGVGQRALAMRTDRPPFSDPRLRRALSLGLDRERWVGQRLAGQGFADAGPVPAPLKPWKLPARALGEGARYLEHDPDLARTLLAEAGFPRGLRVRCTYWPGPGGEHAEDLETLAAHLRTIGVELALVAEEQAQYMRGSAVGRYEEATWGPSPPFTEVDDYLYGPFRSGQPGNRSRVADARLDMMLDAQRRSASRSSRKMLIDEIQRHAAAQVYYVYTPFPRHVSAWAPWVRNYAPKGSLDRGAQLEAVWIDRG
jgi:peptide/nickel transport system substrate-binding protein